MNAQATYQKLQPRLARAVAGRKRKASTELYPRVRDAMTKLLKQEIRGLRTASVPHCPSVLEQQSK